MTREQAVAAIEAGAALAEEAIAAGADLLGTGEMGIGNTTAASAITAAITGAPGRGGDRPRHRRGRRRLAAKGRRGRARAAGERPDPSRRRSTCSRRSAASRSPGSSGVDPGRRRAIACPSRSTASSPAPRRWWPSRWLPTRATPSSPRTARPSPVTRWRSSSSASSPTSTSACGWARGRVPRCSSHLARAAARDLHEMATFKSAGVDGPA